MILSRNAPVCTDLLTIGAGAVIRRDSFFPCYRAEAGVIRTGPVTIGKDAFVGQAAVLDIDTSWAIGRSSPMPPPSTRDSRCPTVSGARDPRPSSESRRTADVLDRGTAGRCEAVATPPWFSPSAAVSLPLGLRRRVRCCPPAFAPFDALAPSVAAGGRSRPGRSSARPDRLAHPPFRRHGAPACWSSAPSPGCSTCAIEPDRVYPLYGLHYSAHRTIARPHQRAPLPAAVRRQLLHRPLPALVGYDLSPVEQTGSNFGTAVGHDNPYLTAIGTGTMVADGLWIINADYSSTSFRLSRVRIGRHNFIGNNIAYPSAGADRGEHLVATKVLGPVDGDVRENVGPPGSRASRSHARSSATADSTSWGRGPTRPAPRGQELAQHRDDQDVPGDAVD